MTSSTFLNYTFGVLFHPVRTFEELSEKENQPIWEALGMILLVSVIGCLNSFSGEHIVVFALYFVFYLMLAIFSWVFTASIIDFLASSFAQKHNFNRILVFTGFALAPWIFLGPINLFKFATTYGVVLAVILSVLIWVWTAALFIIALSKALKISFARALVILIMPFIGSFIAFYWMIGFFSNIISFFNKP